MHAFHLSLSLFLPSNSSFTRISKATTPLHTSTIQLIKPRKQRFSKKNPLGLSSSRCMQTSDTSVSRSLMSPGCCSASGQPLTVADKVNCLAFEFESLTEPIDRVKRLLEYASLLPLFDEAAKLEENRVKGCATQVWLEVEMLDHGLMRFRVDSDSEITKGFCSCLIWLLDGAAPEEVLSVKIDDLFHMNVGFPSRGHSRVNTWHNVLIDMQKRTKELIEEKGRKSSLEDFLLIGYNDLNPTTGLLSTGQECLRA